MKIKKAIKKLKKFNKWKRGANIPQPDPTEIGLIIDKIVKYYKNRI